MPRLKIGLIGCGMVAQVMHLPHLTELSDHFQIVALCDLSATLVNAMGDRYGVERRITASYEEAFKRELYHFYDCVTTGATPLTSGAEAREDTRLMIDLIRAGLRRQD